MSKLECSDFNKICRTCLSEGELESIFNENREHLRTNILISNMIMECSSLQVLEGDGLPAQICVYCVKRIIDAYDFKQRCIQSDSTLRLYIQENTIVNTETYFKSSPEHQNGSDIDASESFNINIDQDSISNCEFEKLNDDIDVNSVNKSNISTDGNSTNTKIKNTLRKLACSKQGKRKSCKKKSSRSTFKCKKCNEVFSSEIDLKEHTRTKKHPDRQIPCTVCAKLLGSRNMYIHMRTHTKEKPYVCSFCDARFSANGNYRRHLMTHTGQRPHKCGVCDKGFIRAVSLEWHMRVHTGERPFVCFCGKAYKQSVQLKMHAKKHTQSEDMIDMKTENDKNEASRRSKVGRPEDVARTHFCNVCKRGFTTKMILGTHMLTHGDKKFLCSDCGKQFHTRMGLDTHLKVHNGNKPYICNICGKSFAYKASLKKHMYVHTGEKPYCCTICDRKFSQSSHMRTHIRLHSGIKPYNCSICSKSFTLKGNLTVHMRIHMGEKPFTCIICEKGFYDSSSLKKHRNRHGDKSL